MLPKNTCEQEEIPPGQLLLLQLRAPAGHILHHGAEPGWDGGKGASVEVHLPSCSCSQWSANAKILGEMPAACPL